ncbi:MAG: hypothetical protein ACREKL_04650, partial [Chthoniobacterales bacterium]
MRFPRLTWLPVIAIAFSASAEDPQQLRDGESPDHHYDASLSKADGKLRFKILVRESRKALGDIPSVYEPLQTTLPNAPELARKTRAHWSPDSRYVVLSEPDNSSVQPAVVLVDVQPDAVKLIPVDVAKMKTLSSKKHENWSLEFGDWLGNKTFLVRLYGMTFHNDRE